MPQTRPTDAPGHHHVFFEEPVGKSLDEIMKELRTWLDENKFVASVFSYTAMQSGTIEVRLTFRDRHHARLFEQDFCGSTASAAAPAGKGWT